MKRSKSLSALNQKYRGKPKKYADGGRVRSPAAAPVASPFDAGYIERLAAQAVGAGEPERDPRDVTLLDRVGRGIGEAYREFVETPERLAQQVYDDAIERGVDPESAARRADRIARRAALTTGAVEMAVPQTPADLALVAAGPLGRVAPAAGRAALGAAGVMMGMEPSEAEAGVIRRAANAVRGLPTVEGYRPVFPQPERLIPEAERVTGGRYLENPSFDPVTRQGSGVDITGQTRAGARVQIDPSGKAIMLVSPQAAELPTKRSQGPLIRTNLFRRSAGWDWAGEPPAGARDFPTIVSVKHGKDHYYALGTDFEGPVQMSRYPGDAEPRLKPTAKGDIELGREIGRISVRGKEEHPVYDMIYNIPRYSHGGLAALNEKYAEGGTVRAPKETTIAGQDHRLAYITPEEAALLKARGGSGRMTDYGVRAYDADPGGDAQGSDPGATDAGPSTDPGPTTDSPGPRGGMSNEDPEGTPAAANMNTAVDAAREGRGVGIADTAGVSPTGFNAAPGIAEAIGAYSRGEISLAEAIGYGLQSGLAPPGVTPGISVDELGVQTPAISVDPLGLGLGLVGMAVGVPGLGALGGRVGSAVSQALGVAPSVFSSNPNEGPAAPSDMGGGEYLQYGQTQYGLPTQTNVASSTTPTPAAPVVDWNQIQREANALNMSVSDYLALKWRSPTAMARGGEVSLEDMEAKYAEGGEVYPPQGEVAYYDPDEIDRIARQIHLRFPAEEDAVYVPADDVASPSDLTTRARMLMQGQNVGQSNDAGMVNEGDFAKISTSLMNLPFEDDRYNLGQRVLSNNLEVVLDPETKARLGIGLQAIEVNDPKGGATGYTPQIFAGYGPLNVQAGYRRMTQNAPGAKPQNSYLYGGNLEVPLDEEGTAARLGANIMSGRRGTMGSGNVGTQIMGSFERPLLGGRLALELAADPSLRHKEILFGYRRAF